ncbi:CgeB family protein [Tissierella creatinophila]|uniref:Spore protein YkvP n=1 Tax=Tissierella creatinophila DSM 6911 TaxID=1123403 RepID=A0A1U7M8R8_TISCR|nr:glycosyltransferase [Tissierella creatinophila]OLS03671.1 spore protein YkvP [Tissierella creatinophila DSM 6911]
MTIKNSVSKNTHYAIEKIKEKLLIKYPENNTRNSDANINIACILDIFSYECFKYEGTFFQLGTQNWKEIMIDKKPKLLFVESTWQGYNQEWINKIADIHISKDQTLFSIISYCKTNKIPTVFWAKEDPYDFNVFIQAAKYFDYVFTTDLDCISKYKEVLSHDNIFLLPFAAQPLLHNPINKDIEKIGSVGFAGGWYEKFPERCIEMEHLLKPAFKYEISIYDRFGDLNDDRFSFPNEYRPYLKNPLDYKDMVKEYKKYNIFLNVNSTNTSPTTFARRVFELLACGIPTISSYSFGVENYFKNIVMLSKDKQDTEKHLNSLVNSKDLRDRLSLLGQREVFNNHTYGHRLKAVLDVLNLNEGRDMQEGVSVIACTKLETSVDNILNNYFSQTYPIKELIIIINNDCIDYNYWNKKLEYYRDIKLFKLSEDTSLAKCLNFGVEKSNYNYISKFEDDYYGPNYLTDSINTFKFTNAHIVGKYSVYVYLENYETLVLQYPDLENRYMDYVNGSTLTFKKEIFNKVKFRDDSKSEETLFLEDSLKEGFKIYASDRFNYSTIKRTDLDSNSWKLTEKDFMKKCTVIEKTKDFRSIVTV